MKMELNTLAGCDKWVMYKLLSEYHDQLNGIRHGFFNAEEHLMCQDRTQSENLVLYDGLHNAILYNDLYLKTRSPLPLSYATAAAMVQLCYPREQSLVLMEYKFSEGLQYWSPERLKGDFLTETYGSKKGHDRWLSFWLKSTGAQGQQVTPPSGSCGESWDEEYFLRDMDEPMPTWLPDFGGDLYRENQ